MARRIDTHLTQSGSEVQDILNWAHCSFPYPPSEVTSPIEGDICVVTEGYHRISIRPADGATSFAFTVASKRVKWEVSEDYDLSDGTIASLTCQSSASEHTTYIIPSPSSRTGEITAYSDAFTIQWVSDKAADLKYITLYGYYEAGVYEYVNGAWVERGDLSGAQRVYRSSLSSVEDPDEGDICIVPAHEERRILFVGSGATSVPLSVPYKKLRWEVGEEVDTVNAATIRYPGDLGRNYYQPIPDGEEGETPTVFGGTIEASGTEFSIIWDDEDVFRAALPYIKIYFIYPAIAYEYKNGSWVERKDMTDVLRYSPQSLTAAQKAQARENILAFLGPDVNKTTIVSNDSLAKYIRYHYGDPGVYSFTFTGKLSDGDGATGTYKAIVITSSTFVGGQYASISNFASFVIIEPEDNFENKLYRVVQRYASVSSPAEYVLEEYYIKPKTGIPAADLASGVIPDVSGKEDVSNKVTSLSDQSTNTEYPSAKAVYDAIQDAATAGLSYDSITESVVVEPPHGSYNESTETITL